MRELEQVALERLAALAWCAMNCANTQEKRWRLMAALGVDRGMDYWRDFYEEHGTKKDIYGHAVAEIEKLLTDAKGTE